jgi:hypothetical protein
MAVHGVNRQYRDLLTGETFDGDYDRLHTFNAYGLTASRTDSA